MVIPPSSTRQPLGIQPTINQPSWGYTYLGNQPHVSNVNYQLKYLGTVYPIIPYPRNMFTPWGKPNLSYIPIPGGTHINTARGYGGLPYGEPLGGVPAYGGHHMDDLHLEHHHLKDHVL